MPGPSVSVVVPTMRVGGLDVLFHGLDGQTFTNFELVLVDGLYARRRGVVEREAASRRYAVTHVEPVGNPFPVNAFCRYANTGLVHARGDVVLFLTDYTWLPPSCVGVHADFHRSGDASSALMCPHSFALTPALSESFKPYDPDAVESYADDVRSGRLDGVLWSLFASPFAQDASLMPRDPDPQFQDPKLGAAAGAVDRLMFHGKNESCRLEKVLEVNGWDEALDGTHKWQDSDLADRLCVRAGVRWQVDPSNVAVVVNPRHVFPPGLRLRPVETNDAMWQARRAAGYPGTVNAWSLAEARKAVHGG